jgi:uncharacterized membrane protein HdeD (DUF308 family)
LASASTPEVKNVEQKTKSHTKIFIFGGVLLVVIALFLFIENSMVKKQE